MKKLAVFGNAGAGKSTLASKLAELTGIPLYCLDKLEFGGRYRPEEKDGGKLSPEDYSNLHRDILQRDSWIIDGYGSVASSWERFGAADTLVYVDLPLPTHYRWVTKRLIAGLFRNPGGWPENSPIWSSSLDSYRVVWRCHRSPTPKYRQMIAESSAKRVHHLKSPGDMKAFLRAVEQEFRPAQAER